MKTRQQQQVSENGLTIPQRNTRFKTLMNGRRENSELLIPIDLIIQILSRLPAKSIGRCRCVSKLWASTLRLPYFTELFLTKSLSRPKLFFSCHQPGEMVFFSAPQVQNPSLVAASYHMKFVFNDYSELSGPLRGLICVTHLRILKRRNDAVPVICNPSTGDSLNLPNVKTNRGVISFLGYDPIDKQFKVLATIYGIERISKEHQVLTLGTTTTIRWRMIECCVPHYASDKGICINGGLYYPAMVNSFSRNSKIVWFDVRYEKFRFIDVDDTIHRRDSTLVNFKGKLGVLLSDGFNGLTGQSRYFELWVLEDTENHEWSKHTYVLPYLWKNVIGEATRLSLVGVTGTNEVVFSSHYPSDHFYVFYYNFERETISRVEIQGIDAFKNRRVDTFLDHLEDVKLIQMF